MLKVGVTWTKEADQDLGLPNFESEGAAGADLRANFSKEDRSIGVSLAPMQRVLVPTGLCLEIPSGFEGAVKTSFWLSFKIWSDFVKFARYN